MYTPGFSRMGQRGGGVGEGGPGLETPAGRGDQGGSIPLDPFKFSSETSPSGKLSHPVSCQGWRYENLSGVLSPPK